ncbi:alpha-2-macroglobulin family protein [Rheinheimera maricola]|uniref:Alpha-2-macroglobulin family protein n=1 Tax=Rheinheimera maricola TaxID=2793282 RepID=A0ABS7X6U7_9GAMM|nr:alpha-2-macroglobulin [Rheinheimera maricola]MBZ9610527.1 alpha-2-macroglobulin family protein [Rheinheimera maricola]
MPASASFLGKIFGSINWTAPNWVQQVKFSAKQQPVKFWSLLLVGVLSVAAVVGGVRYYQQLPKPLRVIASITAPEVGHYQDDIEQPTQLRLQFSYEMTNQQQRIQPVTQLSAARLDLIGEVLNEGISVSPAISGKWLWQDDNSLTFTPEQAWPAATSYQVKLDKSIFAAAIKLAKTDYRFDTAALDAQINRLRFYQHPTEQSTRQIVTTLNFSHPVALDSLKERLSMTMRPDGSDVRSKGEVIDFALTADKSGREVYVQSVALSLPEREQYLTLLLEAGVKAQNGNGKTTQDSTKQLLVPDKNSFLKVEQLRTDIIRGAEQQLEQEPEQMLLLSFTDRIDRAELHSKLKLYVLPKHPKRNSNYWAVGEVNSSVLQQASLLSYELMPTAQQHDSAFSIKLDLPPGQHLFVSVAKGLQSTSEFNLSNEYRAVVQAPAYPKEARIVGEGAMLTLSGEQTLQLLSRGVKGLRVTLHKLLPGELNHFISQSGGDISQPYFNNYQFDESNISSRFEKTFTLANSHAKQANYLSLALKPYLAEAGMGVFFIQLAEFDPKRPNAEGAQLHKRVVLVTDLGLLVKHNNDSSQQVFVMSLADGKPVAGAKVELLGKNGVAVLSGATDSQGSVKLAKTSGFSRERQPVVYLVSRDRGGVMDSSFIPYDRYSRQLDYSKFNTSGRYQDELSSKALSAYMFSDRGIYRPGEQVQLAAIIRHNDLSLAQQQLPLKIQVTGPRGSAFWQQNFSLSGRGMHSFSLDTQAQSDTGNYHASISLLDSKGNTSRHLGSVSFALEEFEADTLKISSRFNQSLAGDTERGWLSPQNLVALVQLDNLFGTAAQQRKVSAKYELMPASFSFSEYPEYRFIAPQDTEQNSTTVRQTLDEQQTDADGKASFELPLTQYSGGTYRLILTTEGFDGSGGKSVQHRRSALLSPLTALVGVKTDGDLSYLKRQQSRNLEFIAINSALAQIALDDLTLQLVEKRPLSSLVKQNDGTYQYQSIVQDVSVSAAPFSIAATGSVYQLPTDSPGDYELQLRQGEQLLGKLAFSVVGAGNISAMLEKNAALAVKLNKVDYSAGDWIELNITAPYTGSGLISIETDKVHAFSWFSSDTTSSIQRIRLPEGLEGNAYINVSFVRGSNSDALFVSPLSYAVVPFNIDRSKRELSISLVAPEEVRPGKPFTLGYKTDRPADVLLYGVDEGILQVAGYQLPDPLSHYLQKRALQVRSLQMLDLILPEFSALQRQLAGVGGDSERIMVTGSRMMLDRNLNPFARRAEQPGVFWLGMVKAGTELATQQVTVPASFSGNLKLMAVAVSDEALSAISQDLRVRGPFVLTPDVLLSAAPGDEFDVSVTVANGVKGSGPAAPITVSLQLPASLTAIGSSERQLNISENSEQSVRFRLKAAETPGEASIRFSASFKQGELVEQASRSVSLSIRPATPYVNTLHAGFDKDGQATVATRYPLHREFAQLSVAASASPLVLVEGFTDYLARYPHGCTEQVVSQVFPWLGLVQQPSYQARWPELNEKFAILLQKLAERQLSDGSFSFWPGSFSAADVPSIYAMHFLLTAREQGLAVPDYLYQQGLEYLRSVARQGGANLYQARARATAIYLLTRSGEVTSNYLTELHERLEKQHQQAWQGDVTASYMAASYQLLQKPEIARGLIRSYRLGKASAMQTAYLARADINFTQYANPTFQSQLSQDAQHIYLLASHFADEARKLQQSALLDMLQPVFDKQYNTYATAYTVLALAAYQQLLTEQQLEAPAFYQLNADGSKTAITGSDNLAALPKREFTVLAESILLQSEQPLFYALSEAGFALKPPTQAVAEQLEVARDYLNSEGQVVNQARQGDELTVRLRIRSLSNSWHSNVAVVDLLPAGFNVIRSSVPRQSMRWRADYVDIREDRIVYYGTFGTQMTELKYQVKVTAAGDFTLPVVQAESMYDNSVHASTAAGRFVVSAANAD